MSSEAEGGRKGASDRGEAELLARLERGVATLDGVALRRLLASPWAGERVVRALLGDEEAMALRAVRKALAAHPATPQSEAMRLLATLYWTDLVEVGRESRTKPQIRRAAHKTLLDRYAGMSVGERVAVARRAGVDLLSAVRHDREPRVIAAMLDNPRLTEGTLLPVLASAATPPAVLALVGRAGKWIARYEVRRMLCRNRRTPLDVVLPLLPRLTRGDLAALARDPGLRTEVRRRCELLGREPGEGRGLG